jgi:metal-dependent hydrolase (beta-lactamase superfamily II)
VTRSDVAALDELRLLVVVDNETDTLSGIATFRASPSAACTTAIPARSCSDERFVAARVRGRGTTVLSACSHAGMVNASLAAQTQLSEPIDVVLDGYHLSGTAMETRIEPTMRDLAEHSAARRRPGHCTGWRAKAALAQAFAPARYGPSVVGSLYTLRAS